MYKQALQYGLFEKMKFATTPGARRRAARHRQGSSGRRHRRRARELLTSLIPRGDLWPPNKTFVEKYYARWKEYPNFQAEGAYTATYMLKTAIEKANRFTGGWPDDDAIISQLEGMGYSGPAGYVYIRPDNHQGYKEAMTGFSKNVPEYPFPILDPDRIITHPDSQHHRASRDGRKESRRRPTPGSIKTWPTVKA